MDWFTGIVLFLLIWWTSIFCVLPWGLIRDERGIPTDPRLKKKLLATTMVSAIIWIAVCALIESDVINFHDMALAMTKEDDFK